MPLDSSFCWTEGKPCYPKNKKKLEGRKKNALSYPASISKDTADCPWCTISALTL